MCVPVEEGKVRKSQESLPRRVDDGGRWGSSKGKKERKKRERENERKNRSVMKGQGSRKIRVCVCVWKQGKV